MLSITTYDRLCLLAISEETNQFSFHLTWILVFNITISNIFWEYAFIMLYLLTLQYFCVDFDTFPAKLLTVGLMFRYQKVVIWTCSCQQIIWLIWNCCQLIWLGGWFWSSFVHLLDLHVPLHVGEDAVERGRLFPCGPLQLNQGHNAELLFLILFAWKIVRIREAEKKSNFFSGQSTKRMSVRVVH